MNTQDQNNLQEQPKKVKLSDLTGSTFIGNSRDNTERKEFAIENIGHYVVHSTHLYYSSDNDKMQNDKGIQYFSKANLDNFIKNYEGMYKIVILHDPTKQTMICENDCRFLVKYDERKRMIEYMVAVDVSAASNQINKSIDCQPIKEIALDGTDNEAEEQPAKKTRKGKELSND